MAKLWASAPDEHRAGASRARNDEAANEPPRDTQQTKLDAELLDIVERFEKGYAELAPSEEPQRTSAPSDELFPEFPDVFEDLQPGRPAAAERARVVPMPRRETEAAAPLSTRPRETEPAPRPRETEAGARPRETRAETDVDLDEAMAILRAAENHGRPAPQPVLDESESPAPVYSAGVTPPEPPRRSRAPDERRESAVAAPLPAEQSAADWSTKSRTTRTIAGAAAITAFAVGIAAGLVLGRTPTTKPSAVIESSQHGGTQLRLERSLPQR